MDELDLEILNELSNWVFKYDFPSKKWMAINSKNVDIFIDKRFPDTMKNDDMHELITDILSKKIKDEE